MMRFLLVISVMWFALAGPVSSQQQSAEPLMGSEAEPGDADALAALAAQAADPALAAPSGFGGSDGIYRIVVIGDALARGLGAGLARASEADPRFEVESRFFESSGLARPQVHDWPAALPRILETQSFDAVVVWLGSNDRQPIRSVTGNLAFRSPEWSVAYQQQAQALLQQAKTGGVKVFWLSLPPMADVNFDADMKLIGDLQRAALAAEQVTLVDLNPLVSNADGTFNDRFIDGEFAGQRLRLRDGISFTKQSNSLLGVALLAEIKRREALPDAPPAQAIAPVATIVPPVEALSAPETTPGSALFGQDDGNGGEIAFEAASVDAQQVAVATTPEIMLKSEPQPLSFQSGSAAEKFFATGDQGPVPTGRFDDFSQAPVAPQ